MTDELIEANAETVNAWHLNNDVILIDVRETTEYEYEHIPGALLLPLSFLNETLFPLIEGKKVVFICQVGKRSAAAQKQVAKEGIVNTVNLIGGIDAWRDAGFNLEGACYEDVDYSI
jgi:phage shock protein E